MVTEVYSFSIVYDNEVLNQVFATAEENIKQCSILYLKVFFVELLSRGTLLDVIIYSILGMNMVCTLNLIVDQLWILI